MIYINNKLIHKPIGWKKKSRKHLRRLKSKDTQLERRTYIDKNEGYWGAFKESMQEVSNYKCWFSEAPEMVGFFHIEHFRPKKKIVKLHHSINYIELDRTNWDEGYWWLSFNWKNYRLSGPSVNSSYKKNYFPLSPLSSVSLNFTNNYGLEQNVLIDPCVAGDPGLITFDIDGTAIPSENEVTEKWLFDRADISIKIYGLNDHEPLLNGRKAVLDTCSRLLKKANDKKKRLDKLKNKTSTIYKGLSEDFSEDCFDLKNMLDPTKNGSYFTSMVKARIKSSGYKWVETFIFS